MCHLPTDGFLYQTHVNNCCRGSLSIKINMPQLVFPSMSSNKSSPSKRIQHALGTIREQLTPNQDLSLLSKPALDETEYRDVDSQISISANLAIVNENDDDSDIYLSTNDEDPVDTRGKKEDEIPTDTVPQIKQQTETNQPDVITQPDELSKSDIATKLFQMIGDLTEQTKAMVTKIDLIPQLQSKITTLSAQMNSLKEDVTSKVADLSAKVLIHDEELNKLTETIQANNIYMNTHIKPTIKKLEKGGLIDNLSIPLLQKITSNEAAITDVKLALETADLDKTVNYDFSDAEITTIAQHVQTLDGKDTPLGVLRESVWKTDTRIKQLEQQLAEMANNISKFTDINAGNNNHVNNNNNIKNNVRNNQKTPATEGTLNHEVIFIGDSNTKHIDMATIGRGTSRKRYTCYSIPQAMDFLSASTIVTQPKKVVFHLGTNDVVQCNDAGQLCSQFDKLISFTRKMFPNSRIYISSIFCRMKKSDTLNGTIKEVNTHLAEFCDRTVGFTLIDNSNINHRDMKDPKHVNPTGFHTFICNLRVAVFGEKHSWKRHGDW